MMLRVSKSCRRVCLRLKSSARFLSSTSHGTDDTTTDAPCKTAEGYDPTPIESKWYQHWEKQGLFKQSPSHNGKQYTLLMPPPNVTGNLHIGHALTNSIQDTLIRWRRMCGDSVLYIPGLDHAGIATQSVVERKLQMTSQITRHDLGREEFLKRVREWVDEHGRNIHAQLRQLGASADWELTAYTLDDLRSQAVVEAFVRLSDDGYLYRATRLVNWCCHLNTALSDLEVDSIEVPPFTKLSLPGRQKRMEFGVMHKFAYPVEDDSGSEIVVATTRLETMLGDTAVAVHPEDERYMHLIGKHVVHPLNGRRIPIIADSVLVDKELGTGAVKITPAHDPNDFSCGERHGLPSINLINDNGSLNAEAGKFNGMDRLDARLAVLHDLTSLGLARGQEGITMRLPVCSRSGDVIEPRVKAQWFVKGKEFCQKAMDAAVNGEIQFQPHSAEKEWHRWLGEERDWCVSRQLWWGHRIPAYSVKPLAASPSASAGGEQWVVARSPEEAAAKAQSQLGLAADSFTLEQDSDVLDTWFSSALFPLSACGWPRPGGPHCPPLSGEEGGEQGLASRYPQSLIETGSDILFFWVARMVMLCTYVSGELPFKLVMLHPLIKDANGRKMSKSEGNVVDPLHVIHGIGLEDLKKSHRGVLTPQAAAKAEKQIAIDFPKGIPQCGADALRMGLLAMTEQNDGINMDVRRVVKMRHFCNKLWNACRFAHMNLQPRTYLSPAVYSAPPTAATASAATFPDASSEEGSSSVLAGLAKRASECSDLPQAWILHRLSVAITAIDSAMQNRRFHEAVDVFYDFFQDELCATYLECMKPAMKSDDGDVATLSQDVLFACIDAGLRLAHPFMPFLSEELWQSLPHAQSVSSIMVSPYPSPTDYSVFFNAKVGEEMEILSHTAATFRALCEEEIVPAMGGKRTKVSAIVHVSDPEAIAMLERNSAYLCALGRMDSVSLVSRESEVPKGCAHRLADNTVAAVYIPFGPGQREKRLQHLQKKLKAVETRVEMLEKRMASNAFLAKASAEVTAATRAEIEELKESRTNFLKSIELL